MIIIIAIGVVVTFSLICYAACVAAGTADDREKELFNKWLEKQENENERSRR
jgi:hypothetical protein